MPEIRIPEIADKYVQSIPKFQLPKEFTESAEPPKAPEKAPEVAEAPKEPEAAEQASATPPDKEPEKETTGKDPEKATTRRFERRIDRATRRAAEAEARASLFERELTELRQKQQVPQKSESTPRMEDFTDVQEYAKAVATFETNKALKEREEKERQTQAHRTQSQLMSGWEEKVNKATMKYDDFDDVVGDLKPTTPWAVAIMQAENGEEIAYYLGQPKNQKEAERIIALDPWSQVREIGKLEMKLLSAPEAPKKPSKAPPPINPVQQTGVISDDEITPNMPFEKYMKIGNKMFRGQR